MTKASFVFSLLLSLCFMIQPATAGTMTADGTVVDFHSIQLKGNYEVFLSQGDHSEYRIEGDAASISSRVENGVLYIENSGKFWNGAEATIYIQVSDFRSLQSSGAVEIHTSGVISANDVSIDLAGATEASLSLEVRKLNLEVAGASEVNIKGSALYADMITAGASEIDALAFKVRSLGIETAGASELEVFVTDELKIKARGASEIRYTGKPANIIRDLKGATSLDAI